MSTEYAVDAEFRRVVQLLHSGGILTFVEIRNRKIMIPLADGHRLDLELQDDWIASERDPRGYEVSAESMKRGAIGDVVRHAASMVRVAVYAATEDID